LTLTFKSKFGVTNCSSSFSVLNYSAEWNIYLDGLQFARNVVVDFVGPAFTFHGIFADSSVFGEEEEAEDRRQR